MINLYLKQGITEKIDIWALGVLLFKLCYFVTITVLIFLILFLDNPIRRIFSSSHRKGNLLIPTIPSVLAKHEQVDRLYA